jgi:hypothetical protein
MTFSAPHVQTARYGAIMEAMVKNWTDERLEERFDRIDQRFDEVDRRFEQVDADLREMRGDMNARFIAMDARFDAMQHLMIQIAAGMMATILAGFLGLIATQL